MACLSGQTWTGTVSGSFANKGNWTGNTVPVSDAANTNLVFSTTSNANVSLSSSINVRSITFSSTAPHYSFDPAADSSPTLGIGGGGLTLSGTTSSFIDFNSGLPISLLANQTWNTGANLSVNGPIAGAFALTKTGTGYLSLGGNSSYAGGTTISAGKLYLTGNSTKTGTAVSSGPVGTGTLTLASGTALSALSSAVTLDNALTASGTVTYGTAGNNYGLTLTGAATLNSASNTFSILGNAPIRFQGNLGQGATTSALTVSGGGTAIFSGTNTYTGGTTVNGGVLFLMSASSLPATGSISLTGAGYIGVGASGLLSTVIGKLSSPNSINGSLGFESADTANPTTFSDALNLGSLGNNFGGIGTFSTAIYNGALTTSSGQDYKFGGGTGLLYVKSTLAANGSAGLSLASSTTTTGEDDHLTVILQGTNSFTGNVKISAASLVFDSAMPSASGTTYTLNDDGYLGYTENAGLANFAAFKTKITVGSSSRASDAIIGLDSATTTGRTVTDTFDLSGLGAVYFGTATKITLSGTSVISNPSGGILKLAGVDRGFLKIEAPLLSANGITSLNVGFSENEPGDVSYNGYVALSSATSNFTGGTTLQSGSLLLGASSTGAVGNVTSGPLGKGTLTINGSADAGIPLVVAGAANVTLHNAISNSLTTLKLGAPVTNDTNSIFYPLQPYTANNLTLLGAITGGTPTVEVHGTGILTLGGANTFGTITGYDGGRIVASHNTALGGSSSAVYLFDGSDLQFTTTAPTIGNLSGGNPSSTNASYLALAAGSTLTVNQTSDATFAGNVGGEPTNYADNKAPPVVAAGLVKNGTGTLTLTGNSTFTGGTVINAGTFAVGSTGLLSSTGDVTIATGAVFSVGNNQTTRALTGSGAVQIADGQTLTVSLPSSGTANSATFSGTLTGNSTATLAESGSGTLTLTGSSPGFAGPIVVNSGTLKVGNANALGSTTAGTTVAATGTLAINNLSLGAEPVNLNGNGAGSGGALVGLGTASLSGPVTLATTAAIGTPTASDSLTLSGTIGETGGARGLLKVGAGTLTLTGASTFTGPTTVSAGTLVIGGVNALPTSAQISLALGSTLQVSANQTITGFFGTASSGSTILINSGKTLAVDMPVANTFTTYSGSLTGAGVFSVSGAGGDIVNLTGTVASTVTTLTGSGATLVIGSAPIAISAPLAFSANATQTLTNVISGTGSIAISAGNTTLAAANTYTGPTAVTGGKLVVSNTGGSATGSGTVTVSSGGVIGGSGIITGPLVLSAGGSVSPGNSPGTLSVGPTTFAGGANLAFDINDANGVKGTNWDLLSISGSLNITASAFSPFAINLTSLTDANVAGPLLNFSSLQPYSWQFVTTTGITGFSAGVFQFDASQFQNSLGTGHFYVSQDGNNLLLNFTPVPEPSTYVLLVAGLGVIGIVARRRAAKSSRPISR